MKAFDDYFLKNGEIEDNASIFIENLLRFSEDLISKVEELEGRIKELEDAHPYRNLKSGEKVF
jgi:hypothetical protein